MGWNSVGMLAEVEGKMNPEQYVDILNDHLLPSLAESEIDETILFSNRIMIPSTHPEELGNGLKNITSMFLTGQHSLLMSMSLNISGEHSRKASSL